MRLITIDNELTDSLVLVKKELRLKVNFKNQPISKKAVLN
jgi:hypothetical protein